MPVIDAFASEIHYLSHLLPVWRALPEQERGFLHIPPGLLDRTTSADSVLVAHPPRRGGPVLVASFWDARKMAQRPVVLMEHGVGQTYRGERHGSYAGGRRRENVVLFLCPTQAVAEANAARYPNAPAVVIGSPRLDRTRSFRQDWPRVPTVAVTFHWDCKLNPETRSALPHYRSALPDLIADPRWTTLGHAHPRDRRGAARLWADLGVEFEPDFERVLDDADILVADNTSALYEFAATGRPVVVLDAPWYRRGVEHGLRFWEHADVGIRIGEPGLLVGAVAEALEDPRHVRQYRERIVRDLFGDLLDGRASERAAEAIRETVGERVGR